jgi:uncharacterized protein (DUF362 family)
MTVISIECTNYCDSVEQAFAQAGGPGGGARFERLLLKPNLVNASPFPITTHVDFVAAVIAAVREHSDAPIVVAEGCGDAVMETTEVFEKLGYVPMAEELGVELLDLNHAPTVRREQPDCAVFAEMWLPEVTFTHGIISLPVLKAHSLAGITGTMKNMMGFAPPKHYQGGGPWKKASFHAQMQGAIRDLNRYVSPHLTIMDATVGMAEYHLGGPKCVPAVGKVLASTDPLALDREAAGLLGMDWHQVGHLA